MTAQIDDNFDYNRKQYSISAIEYPAKFFVIQELGIDPEMASTACYRGYIATFKLRDNRLVLSALNTNNSNGKAQPVTLNNVHPAVVTPEGLVSNYRQWREWHYKKINLPLSYTGAILITDDFISDMYIHMGHQSPLSYREVIELSFRSGELVRTEDLSMLAQSIRDGEVGKSKEDRVGFPDWIEKSFDLSYVSKWNPDAAESGSRK